MRLENERVFKYSAVIYHLFLYYQADKFPFPIEKLDIEGNLRSVVFWTPRFQKYEYPYPYTYFIDLFLHIVATMLIGSPPPRIGPDIWVLHLSKQYKVGDWYLYHKYIEIRIYGYEFPPYKLLKYLPMRLFALEYYRKIIKSNEVHFVKGKKKGVAQDKTPPRTLCV